MTHQDGPTADAHDPAPGAAPRCPTCGALRPPAVAWCTQCYARFDVPEASGRSQDPDPAPVADASDPSDPGGGEQPDLGPSAPRREPAEGGPVAPEEVEARAQELLAQLAGEGAGDERVRSWSEVVAGSGNKTVAIVVGTLVLTGLLFGVMAVLGALL